MGTRHVAIRIAEIDHALQHGPGRTGYRRGELLREREALTKCRECGAHCPAGEPCIDCEDAVDLYCRDCGGDGYEILIYGCREERVRCGSCNDDRDDRSTP